MKINVLRVFTILVLFLIPMAILSPVASAAKDPFGAVCNQLTDKQKAETPACTKNSGDPIAGNDGILSRVVSLTSWLVGILSVIMIVYGSIKYILSSGDSSKVSAAKETILYAAIGIVVAILARAIISFVLNRTN